MGELSPKPASMAILLGMSAVIPKARVRPLTMLLSLATARRWAGAFSPDYAVSMADARRGGVIIGDTNRILTRLSFRRNSFRSAVSFFVEVHSPLPIRLETIVFLIRLEVDEHFNATTGIPDPLTPCGYSLRSQASRNAAPRGMPHRSPPRVAVRERVPQ